MNARILNRTNEIPADGWYQIEVTGKHPAGKGRKQVIDRTALESILNRFNAEKEAAGEDFAGMLVDADHLSHDLENDTAALAWAKELEIRNNQLHGRLELTDLGEPAVKNKRYKFFSTEYNPEDLEDLGNGEVRPLRLAGLAFTNRPNNRGGKPISNRDGLVPGGEPKPNQQDKPPMKNIATKLGLPAESDEAAILTEIESLLSKLKAASDKEASTEADTIMNRMGARIPDAVKPLWKEKLIANREETEKLMEASFPAKSGEPEKRIFNRETSTTPPAVGDGATAESNKKATAIRNRAIEISRKEKIGFNQAFARASGELG